MNSTIESLPVLIVNPYSRCNCRCVMCDIWKDTGTRALSPEDLERHLASIAPLDVQWIVFSGGEPLMHPAIFQLCAIARAKGARVTLLSTGLLLAKHAKQIVEHVDDLIVSIDGPAEVHDRIRRVTAAFDALAFGIARVHALSPSFPVAGRCTVQRLNCGNLLDTVTAARSIGMHSISFLAADLHSSAFNRPGGWDVQRQSGLGVGFEQMPALESQLETLIASGYCGNFVVESPAKLRKIAHHFRCHLNLGQHVAPACNAPWTSAVIEADGTVRPCFFHRAIGNMQSGDDLLKVLNGAAAQAFRKDLDVATDPMCRRCVCSLNWKPATVGQGVS